MEPLMDAYTMIDPTLVDAASGPVRRRARQVAPYAFSAEYVAGSKTGVLAASATDQRYDIQSDGSYEFRGYKLAAAYSDPRFKLNFELGSLAGEKYLDRPAPFSCIAGSGGLPLILRQPIVLAPADVLGVLASDDGTAATNSIRLTLHGVVVYPQPFYPPRTYRRKRFQAITFNFSADSNSDIAAPAASGVTNFTKALNAGADFEVWGVTIRAVGGFLIQIEQSTPIYRKWFDRPIHASNLSATTSAAAIQSAMAAFLFPRHAEPFITGSGGITITVEDLTGAASNNIFVTLLGRRLEY